MAGGARGGPGRPRRKEEGPLGARLVAPGARGARAVGAPGKVRALGARLLRLPHNEWPLSAAGTGTAPAAAPGAPAAPARAPPGLRPPRGGRHGAAAAAGDPQLRERGAGVPERAAAAGAVLRRLGGGEGPRVQGAPRRAGRQQLLLPRPVQQQQERGGGAAARGAAAVLPADPQLLLHRPPQHERGRPVPAHVHRRLPADPGDHGEGHRVLPQGQLAQLRLAGAARRGDAVVGAAEPGGAELGVALGGAAAGVAGEDGAGRARRRAVHLRGQALLGRQGRRQRRQRQPQDGQVLRARGGAGGGAGGDDDGGAERGRPDQPRRHLQRLHQRQPRLLPRGGRGGGGRRGRLGRAVPPDLQHVHHVQHDERGARSQREGGGAAGRGRPRVAQPRAGPAGPGVAPGRARHPDRQPLPPQALRRGRPRREAGAGHGHQRVHHAGAADELPRQRGDAAQGSAAPPPRLLLRPQHPGQQLRHRHPLVHQRPQQETARQPRPARRQVLLPELRAQLQGERDERHRGRHVHQRAARGAQELDAQAEAAHGRRGPLPQLHRRLGQAGARRAPPRAPPLRDPPARRRGGAPGGRPAVTPPARPGGTPRAG